MSAERALLARIEAAFSAVARPQHFTDFAHCAECADHDDRLQACSVRDLGLEDVAYVGCDPFCVALPSSFAYFFPALARLALGAPVLDHGWYGTQLLFHLGTARRANGFHALCTPVQRAAVHALLRHLMETRSALLAADRATHDCLDAYHFWAEAQAEPALN